MDERTCKCGVKLIWNCYEHTVDDFDFFRWCLKLSYTNVFFIYIITYHSEKYDFLLFKYTFFKIKIMFLKYWYNY